MSSRSSSINVRIKNDRSRDTIKYTSCSYHCFDKCILKVRIRDEKVIAIEPDDTINSGVAKDSENLFENQEWKGSALMQRRPCSRGYAIAQELYHPDRLLYPMKRVGERGSGKFERISWEEALDTIAEKLVEVKEKYGPYSVIHHPYSAAGMCSFPLAKWFGAGVAGWSGMSLNGTHEAKNWVHGKDMFVNWINQGYFPEIQDEGNIFKSKLIVLWGYNPAVMSGAGVNVALMKARESGIPVICIEQRYTPSVEIHADQWIPIRPSTDVAMMIAIANVWFKEDLCDKAFIEKWVEPEGFRRWKAYVLGTDDGEDKSPQWAERICGVPAETITELARLYIKSKPVNLVLGMAMGRTFHGENATRAAMYLQLLSGNTGIPGGTTGADDACPWGAFSSYNNPMPDWQEKPGTYEPPVLLAGYKTCDAILEREKLDRGEISKEEYNTSIGNMPDNPAPNIQAVILETSNFVGGVWDINKNIKAMKKVAFTMGFFNFAESTGARYCDILLPQQYTSYEGRNAGRVAHATNLFPSFTTFGSYVTYRQKCVEAPGEVKPNDWVWTQVAKRLGIAELFNPRMVNVADEDWDEVIEDIHQEAYETWAVRPDIAPLNPPSWEEFQKNPVFRFEAKGEPHYAFKEEMESGGNPFKGTKSGKAELYSQALAGGNDYLKTHDVPLGSGHCLGQEGLPPMAQMTMGGHGETFFSDNAKKYPLYLSTPKSFYRVHSWLDNSPMLTTDCYRHAVWINVADAKRRGIMDNDQVRVFSEVAEMILPAYVTSRIVPGSVVIHHGSWYMPGKKKTALMPEGVDMRGAPNLLIHGKGKTALGGYSCKGNVEIEKWVGEL